MKLAVKSPPGLFPPWKTIAKLFRNPLACFLATLLLLAGFAQVGARADDGDFRNFIRQLAKKDPSPQEYVDAIVKLLETHPVQQAAAIIAEAVKDEPHYACQVVKAGLQAIAPSKSDPNVTATLADEVQNIVADGVKAQPTCACELVKDGIQTLTPYPGGALDPKQVASLVAVTVQNIQITNPDLLETIVSCATEADPEAGPQILAAIASIFTGPQGGLKGNMFLGGAIFSPTPVTPFPTPTPPAPNSQMTTFQP